MSQLIITLPESVLQRIQNRASDGAVSVDDLVLDAIETYLDDDDEPTIAELQQMIQKSQQDLRYGKLSPFEAMMTEMRESSTCSSSG